MIAAVLWLPWWIQVAVCIVGIFLAPYPLMLVVTAVVSDVLYAPGTGPWIANARATIGVLCIVLLYITVTRNTRFGQLYAVEKKS